MGLRRNHAAYLAVEVTADERAPDSWMVAVRGLFGLSVAGPRLARGDIYPKDPGLFERPFSGLDRPAAERQAEALRRYLAAAQ